MQISSWISGAIFWSIILSRCVRSSIMFRSNTLLWTYCLFISSYIWCITTPVNIKVLLRLLINQMVSAYLHSLSRYVFSLALTDRLSIFQSKQCMSSGCIIALFLKSIMWYESARKQILQGMMIHKTLYGKLKIMHHETYNSCATEV